MPEPDGVLNVRAAGEGPDDLEVVVTACALCAAYAPVVPLDGPTSILEAHRALGTHLIQTHGRRSFWVRCLNIDTPPVLILAGLDWGREL